MADFEDEICDLKLERLRKIAKLDWIFEEVINLQIAYLCLRETKNGVTGARWRC